MEYDDKIRSKMGLVVCLRDMGNGNSRIFIDDVKSDQQKLPINWKHDYFYTFTPEFNNEVIDEMQLSDDDFQKIGEVVVARLLASNGRAK